MKKWKKFLIPAVCLFLMQSPAVAFAEGSTVTDGSVTSTVENPADTVTPPEQVSKIVVEKGKRHYYINGVLQKNCWDPSKTYYFDKKGNAYAAPKDYISKKNVVAKKIGKYRYCFDRNGRKVTNGIYANANFTAYVVDKKGVVNTKKTKQLNKAAKQGQPGKVLRKLMGKKKPKTKYMSSCSPGMKRDVDLTYANVIVSLGQRTDGSEMVYGIRAR